MNSGQRQLSIGAGTPEPADPAVPVPATAPAASAAGEMRWKDKTVLLVDANRLSRDSRAKIMGAMGVRIQCAPTAEAARALLQSGTYNLILVDPGRDIAAAESLVKDIKAANSRQLVGFLVGRPLFVATSLKSKPRPHREPAITIPAVAAAPPISPADDFGQRVRDAEAEQGQ